MLFVLLGKITIVLAHAVSVLLQDAVVLGALAEHAQTDVEDAQVGFDVLPLRQDLVVDERGEHLRLDERRQERQMRRRLVHEERHLVKVLHSVSEKNKCRICCSCSFSLKTAEVLTNSNPQREALGVSVIWTLFHSTTPLPSALFSFTILSGSF